MIRVLLSAGALTPRFPQNGHRTVFHIVIYIRRVYNLSAGMAYHLDFRRVFAEL